MIKFLRKSSICKNCLTLSEIAEIQRKEIKTLKEVIRTKESIIEEKERIILNNLKNRP